MTRRQRPIVSGVARLGSSLWRRPSQLVPLARALALFAGAELLVRFVKLPRAARLAGTRLEFTDRPPGRDPRGLGFTASQRRALATLGRVAPYWPLGPSGACLRHSLAAGHVLRSRSPRLRIAVGSTASAQLSAHAWIEVDGAAVTDPGSTYLPLLEAGGSAQG